MAETSAAAAPRFQVVLTRCVDCGATAHNDHAVEDALVEMVDCDHETVRMDHPEQLGHLRRKIRPALRRAVLARDGHRCRATGCRNGWFVDLHHVQPVSTGGGDVMGNLVTLCGVHHAMLHRGTWEMSLRGEGLAVAA